MSTILEMSPMADASAKISCNHGFVRTSCAECSLIGLCLPIAMDVKDVDRIDEIIQRSRPIKSGEYIFRSGDKFTSVYAVRSGSIKSFFLSDQGVEQVTGFYLPGELLGFDGISEEVHACNVVALETSTVCEIPFHRMEDLSTRLPKLQHHFFQLMSQRIQEDQHLMMTLSKKNAEERIATLLLSLSNRNRRRKYSAKSMRLPMSRMDIGNFLGLTIETVSRTFSKLQKNRVLSIEGREVEITDFEALHALCNGER